MDHSRQQDGVVIKLSEIGDNPAMSQHEEITDGIGQTKSSGCFAKFKRFAKRRILTPLNLRFFALCVYMAYFLVAMARCLNHGNHCPGDKEWWTLVVLTSAILLVCLFKAARIYLTTKFGSKIERFKSETISKLNSLVESPQLPLVVRRHVLTPRILLILVPAACVLFVLVDAAIIRRDPNSLISMFGLCVIIGACILFSHSRTNIRARPAVAGLALQFAFAIFILRIPVGEIIFTWLGDTVSKFLKNGNAGALFVWRSAFLSGDFTFAILPVIPFFAAVTSVLYYLGWVQVVIGALATMMEKLAGTTAGESTSCSANIFLGMTEAPLLIRPFIRHMTKSELHAVMTGGFATIAGGSMGAFIALKVEPQHLLAASIMAAPASLALSKLVYPETEQSRMRARDVKHITGHNDENPKPSNVLEAACEGATAAIPMVAGVVSNLIAINAILSLIDSLVAWFGERVGLAPPFIDEPFSLEMIASYFFWPFALLIGTPIDDCRQVGKLLGIKFFTNEFVAYIKMGKMIEARNEYEDYYCRYVHSDSMMAPPTLSPSIPSVLNGSNLTAIAYDQSQVLLNGFDFNSKFNSSLPLLAQPIKLANDSFFLPLLNATLIPFISRRSQSLTTYALCGFANLASIGIQMGSIVSLAPSKKVDIASFAFRSMLTGTAVNLINAATAGMLLGYEEPHWDDICSLAATATAAAAASINPS